MIDIFGKEFKEIFLSVFIIDVVVDFYFYFD